MRHVLLSRAPLPLARAPVGLAPWLDVTFRGAVLTWEEPGGEAALVFAEPFVHGRAKLRRGAGSGGFSP
jgi:hypothetical protein